MTTQSDSARRLSKQNGGHPMNQCTWFLNPLGFIKQGGWTVDTVEGLYYCITRVPDCPFVRTVAPPPPLWFRLRVSGGGVPIRTTVEKAGHSVVCILWDGHQTRPRGFLKWRPLVESAHVGFQNKMATTRWVSPRGFHQLAKYRTWGRKRDRQNNQDLDIYERSSVLQGGMIKIARVYYNNPSSVVRSEICWKTFRLFWPFDKNPTKWRFCVLPP